MSQIDTTQAMDHQLRQAVLDALAEDSLTARLALRVGALNAIVHLAGEVPNLDLRARAEQVAAAVPGVRGVVNRIEAPGAPSPSRTIHLDLFSPSDKGE